jgi:hypothetical protein
LPPPLTGQTTFVVLPRRWCEVAYYRCYAPRGTRLRELVRVAGSRWGIEEAFQTAENEVGLDHYPVRRYDAWYAHITLSMTAAAFLAITRTQEAAKGAAIPMQTRSSPLTSNEIRRLLNRIVHTGRTPASHILHWSRWRRRRQAQARTTHYLKRLKPP